MSLAPILPMMRRLRNGMAWLLLAVLVLYGVSNLWLNSRWGAGLVERKLKGRTGMEWSIGGMSWSPWNGLSVRGVALMQPEELREYSSEPVLVVAEIQVRPYWRALLRGQVYPRDVIVDSPQGNISVEMLSALLQSMNRGRHAEPAVVSPGTGLAQVDPQVRPQENPLEGSSLAQISPKDEAESSVAKIKPEPPEVVSTAPRPAQPTRSPAGLPINLQIRDASVGVVSLRKGRELFRVGGVDFKISLLGEDAQGDLEVDRLDVLGSSSQDEWKESLTWERPYLKWENSNLDVNGVRMKCRARIALAAEMHGVAVNPFMVDCVADPQELTQLEGMESFALGVSAEKVAAKLHIAGLLRRPGTWRVDMKMLGSAVHVNEKHGGHDVVLDEVVVPAAVRGGVLYWGGVKGVGEDVSILGNGRLSIHEGVLSVTRLVVSPEVSQALNRGLNGAGLSSSGQDWWQNLDTEDRKMRDLLVSGSLSDPVIDAGGRHEEIPLWGMMEKVVQFVRGEMKEEGEILEETPMEMWNHKDASARQAK